MSQIQIHYTSNEEIKVYYEGTSHYLNQSFLKSFLGGLESQEDVSTEESRELYYKEYQNFILGDYLDGYLTRGPEYLREKYFSEVLPVKPSDAVMSIIKEYFETVSEIDLSSSQGLLDIAREAQYRNNYGDAKLLETLEKEGTEYFKFLKRAQGKQIISKEEFDIIVMMTDKINKSEHIKNIFKAPWKYFSREESLPELAYEIYFQKVIYFEFQGEPCKALIDILIIERDIFTQEITNIHIGDLKTTGKAVMRIHETVNRFRYDIQLAWYRLAVAKEYNFNEIFITCSLLVVGKKNNILPLIKFNISEDLLLRGMFGSPYTDVTGLTSQTLLYNYETRPFFGIKQCMNTYLHYKENPGISEDVYKYGDEYVLNLNTINAKIT